MGRRALITGITGQDGAYLARFLLDKGYEVYGGYRRSSRPDTGRLERIGAHRDVRLVSLELLEYESLKRTVEEVAPDEIYNLAAQSFVADSFKSPLYTLEANGAGVARLLEVIRGSRCRFYQASTSEQFGTAAAPQSEVTQFHPRSPYAAAKLYAHSMCVNYREAYGMHVSCGILFNHESALRGAEFVTQKIATAARTGSELRLGNLKARRDWGYAGDYVRAMWLMLQQPYGDDFVIATGQSHSVQDFIDRAYRVAGRVPEIVIDEMHLRPAEVPELCGDATKARLRLGWEPEVGFDELVEKMVRGEP